MARPYDDRPDSAPNGRKEGSVTVAELMARMSQGGDRSRSLQPRRTQPQRHSSDYRATDYVQRENYETRTGPYSQPLDALSAADLAGADELMSWPDCGQSSSGETGTATGTGQQYSSSSTSAEPPVAPWPQGRSAVSTQQPTAPQRRPQRSWIINDADTEGFARPEVDGPLASNVGQDCQMPITAGMDTLGPQAAEDFEREIAESRARYAKQLQNGPQWDTDFEWDAHDYAEQIAEPDQQEVAAATTATAATAVASVGTAKKPQTRVAQDRHSNEHVNYGNGAKGRLMAKLHHVAARDVDRGKVEVADRILQVVQIIVTAIAGGLFFWLFDVLWARPSLHIITFGMALAVQVVMVVAARLLRRREEFWVLIFTWVVAFFVTIGPMVLPPN